MPTPAIILAGGQARRMGGGDKALLPLGGRVVLDHILDRLHPQVGDIAINANGDPARFATFGLPVIPDSAPDYPGPLAGILAGMDWAATQDAHHVLSVAGDTPFFPHDLVTHLSKGLKTAPIAMAKTNNGRHPTFALWPVDLRDDLRTALKNGTRKVIAWSDAHGCTDVTFPDLPFDPFFNINTPKDLQKAEGMT